MHHQADGHQSQSIGAPYLPNMSQLPVRCRHVIDHAEIKMEPVALSCDHVFELHTALQHILVHKTPRCITLFACKAVSAAQFAALMQHPTRNKLSEDPGIPCMQLLHANIRRCHLVSSCIMRANSTCQRESLRTNECQQDREQGFACQRVQLCAGHSGDAAVLNLFILLHKKAKTCSVEMKDTQNSAKQDHLEKCTRDSMMHYFQPLLQLRAEVNHVRRPGRPLQAWVLERPELNLLIAHHALQRAA